MRKNFPGNFIVEENYEPLDGCYGQVQGTCQSGAFLRLDNGQEAFAYKFAHLYPGSLVLCTVRRPATKDRRMLVSIDAVLEHASRAA